MQYPKRLIEVDLPIKRISAHARREKSIRHGHISTLHIWWARRPLAACRAVICASLWVDPVDPLCPQVFRDEAATLINQFAKKAAKDKELAGHCSPENWEKWQVLAKPGNQLDPTKPEHLNILRYRLLDFIADFANWNNSTQPDYLETSRALTQAAHEALGGLPGTKPLVVDPFAGGGAIPLEALRVGADAFASDLNPVAVLLNKVMLEYVPKYGQRLADEVRKWGQWVKEEAEKELAEFYPKDPDGAVPIAYLWTRTIICEGPKCGSEVPMLRSPWLFTKGSNSVALKLIPKPEEQRVDFSISHNVKAKEVGNGTVKRSAATCPCCGYTTPVHSVKKQISKRQGGTKDARLIAVVTSKPEHRYRTYRLANSTDIEIANKAANKLEDCLKKIDTSMSPVPHERTPQGGGSGAGRAFSQRQYGMEYFEDLFTPRQLLSMITLIGVIKKLPAKLPNGYDAGLAVAVQAILAIGVSKITDIFNALCSWQPSMSRVVHLFARQAIPIIWDFAETSALSGASGDYEVTMKNVLEVLEREAGKYSLGHAEKVSATDHVLPDDSASSFITDPPYYDAVPYSDLSDFFYVWLKRALPDSLKDLFTEELTSKEEECIVDDVKGKDRAYFEKSMMKAMTEGRRILSPSGIGTVVFAHKTTSGWEALLQAMVDAGWIITSSWPIDTEWGTRMRAQGSAALASSVHLVCRPREDSHGSLQESIGDWRDVLQELPKRIHEWMPRLASEGVVGADAIFACLGPALEIFSRYSRVEKASGEQVLLREYLENVWGAVSKEALGMIFENADTAGFEEDARLTAMWLWTLSTGEFAAKNLEAGGDKEAVEDDEEDDSGKTVKVSGYTLEYDAARKIAQGLGAHLERLTTLIEIKGDKARLLPVAERAAVLLGKTDIQTPTKSKKKNSRQLSLLSPEGHPEDGNEDWGDTVITQTGATVLDRIHQSMILFAAGRSEALKRFLVDDGVGQDQRFWRLAQALSALYPIGSDEKRWVDGVLARKKGLGF